MLDSEIVLNKSKTYLLYYFVKSLGIDQLGLLKNTYLYYEGYPYVCFLYYFSGKKEFSDYERALEKNEFYYKTIDVSKDKVLYVMKVPPSINQAVLAFEEGRYSQLPEKEELIAFLKIKFGATEDSKIIRIIRKDITLKKEIEELIGEKLGDLDLSSSPDFDKENFTSKIYEKEPEHDDIWKTDNLQNQVNAKGNGQSAELPSGHGSVEGQDSDDKK